MEDPLNPKRQEPFFWRLSKARENDHFRAKLDSVDGVFAGHRQQIDDNDPYLSLTVSGRYVPAPPKERNVIYSRFREEVPLNSRIVRRSKHKVQFDQWGHGNELQEIKG